MDEPEFWPRLEYRLCGELGGFAERDIRRLWCDGFVPVQFVLDDQSPRILGHAWMGLGRGTQEKWEFTLLRGRSPNSREEIRWDTILPRDNVTRWLTVDLHDKYLVIEPAVAMPDSGSGH